MRRIPFEELLGKKYGRLTIVSELDKRGEKRYMKCVCDCGKTTSATLNGLRKGSVKSCGCLQVEKVKEANTTHGDTAGGKTTKLYWIWNSMRQRCANPNNKHYKDYGGRGITVCEEWLDSYNAFKKWAESSGYRQGLTIDRMDNDKGYCPSNCHFTDMKEQVKNQRIRRSNTSGIKGIAWDSKRSRWVVQLTIDGRRKKFGYFSNLEVAKNALNQIRHQ